MARLRTWGPDMVSAPIDIVYTWVDGERADYRALVARHASTHAHINPERTRDDLELLRFSLRSVWQFVPWINRVHVVAQRPQVPSWLDTERVTMVHHDEIFEDPANLPTFNCNAIESHLHRVRTSSDWFLYCNDDFLFGAPTPRDTFVTDDGRIRVAGTLFGRSHRRVHDRCYVPSLGFIEHGPLLIYRPWFEEMIAVHRAEVEATRARRFRGPRDVRMDGLYRHHLLTHHAPDVVPEPFWRYVRYARFHKITRQAARQRRALAALRANPPRFYCLNDDQRDTPNPAVQHEVRRFLEASYPTPSPYERTTS